MASTASTSLNLELQTQGENDGTWGDKQKTNMQIIDAAIAGRTTVSLSGADATLADADYTLDAAKYGYLYTSDADQDDRAIIIPNAPRTYIVHNASGTYQIGVKTSSGSAITIPAASVCKVSCDGSNTCTFSTPLTNAGTGAPNTSSGAAASAVSVVPSGDLTSTTVQSALTELQGDIDAIEADLLANYQPLDTDLTQIAGLSRSKGALIAGSASAWAAQSVGTNGYVLMADSTQANGVKWASMIPSGTDMLFYQAAAPTGWTGSNSFSNHAIRVVTTASASGGSSGGSTAFTSVFAARTITQANLPNVNLTAASNGAHTHVLAVDEQGGGSGEPLIAAGEYLNAYGTTGNPASGYNLKGTSTTPDVGITASGGAHTHTVPLGGSGTAMDFAVAYISTIVAAKD